MQYVLHIMKIFLDSGDPSDTREIINIFNHLEGQTTNPSLITKHPKAKEKFARGEKFTNAEISDFYKKIIEEISGLVPQKSVSIEVYVDSATSVEDIVAQAQDMFTWIPYAHIKIPITKNGLAAAKILSQKGIRLNMTLCFSQEQAAAVYAATKGAKVGDVFVSPFVGRIDDKGENGIDLIANIMKMYAQGDGHVEVLSASLRTQEHLLDLFRVKSDLATVPFKILKEWVEKGQIIPNDSYIQKNENLSSIPYQELDLNKDWKEFNIQHDLTDTGLARFVEDWNKLIIK